MTPDSPYWPPLVGILPDAHNRTSGGEYTLPPVGYVERKAWGVNIGDRVWVNGVPGEVTHYDSDGLWIKWDDKAPYPLSG